MHTESHIHILLIDDDKLLSPFVKEYLESKGFIVKHEPDGEEGLKSFEKSNYDLILLDVKMPFKDGFAVAEEIRSLNKMVPIIFVTSEGEQKSRIEGLKLGADDYLVKPYSMEELYLRIQNLLKRSGFISSSHNNEDYNLGNALFSFHKREIEINGKSFQLSTLEAKLLKHLITSPEGVIKNESALYHVWGDKHAIKGRSLTVYISKLRKYLEADSNISILNLHGEGYQLVVQKI